MPQIRIGEDGTIISSEGDIAQGNNPIIGDDGTINLGSEPAPPGYATHRTSAPASPLEGVSQPSSSAEIITPPQRTAPSRPIQSIEYDLSLKKAEMASSLHVGPIIGVIVIILIAFSTGFTVLAWAAVLPGVSVLRDIAHRSESSAEVQRLENELESARRHGGTR